MKIHFIQHVLYETPGYVLQWAREQQYSVSFTKMFESPEFPLVTSIDMLVVMGGPMGVYDEEKYSWLKPEKAFIKETIAAGKKVIGICLGSQLVAEALGAKVYPHTEKEIGWFPVKKINGANDHEIIKHLPGEFITFHWHGDTFDLPAGASHLLQSNATRHQAYIFNKQVMGLQFHMEAMPGLVAEMVNHGKEDITPAANVQPVETILSQTKYYGQNNSLLDGLLTEFIKA